MIFNGKQFAREIEDILRQRLRSGMRVPKIVSVLVGRDHASELYTKLKIEAAKRVGIEFEVRRIEAGKTKEEIFNELKLIGEQKNVTGVMVQLPIFGLNREETMEVLEAIPLGKDVDGLRWEESGKMPATVRAIFSILKEINNYAEGSELWVKRFVVVGSHGSVGKPLVHFLKIRGVREVEEVNSQNVGKVEILKTGEVVISSVGSEGIVAGEMVSEGVIAIDVGSPKGDMTEEVYQKASVAVPVPGGVGPVTVASLMENAIEMVE